MQTLTLNRCLLIFKETQPRGGTDVEVVRLVRVRAYTRWQKVTFDNSFESRNFADA